MKRRKRQMYSKMGHTWVFGEDQARLTFVWCFVFLGIPLFTACQVTQAQRLQSLMVRDEMNQLLRQHTNGLMLDEVELNVKKRLVAYLWRQKQLRNWECVRDRLYKCCRSLFLRHFHLFLQARAHVFCFFVFLAHENQGRHGCTEKR